MDVNTMKQMYNTLSGVTVCGEKNLDALLGCMLVLRREIEAAERKEAALNAGNNPADS